MNEAALMHKRARLMREMQATEGWKVFSAILGEHIATRMNILMVPLHDLPTQTFGGMDFESRAAALESVKGAVIGLKLALTLPESIMTSAADLPQGEDDETS
jgi:hypothetical protein